MNFTVKREPFKFYKYISKFFSDLDNLSIKNVSTQLIEHWNAHDSVMSYNPFDSLPYKNDNKTIQSLFFYNMNNFEIALDWHEEYKKSKANNE